jgi:peptide subunit release factor 1 (eRF1)
MQANDITSERLRRLAGIRAGDAKVLSLFVNLDPRQFAIPAARRTEVRSLLDRAARRVRDENGLSHAAQASLRSDLERLETEFGAGGLDAKGARGLAIFTASALDLFEVLKLPEPVEHGPVIAATPFIEPLSAIGTPERWCALLVNRRVARLFCGPGAALAEIALEEIEHIEDDVSGRHDQGGWSQPNHQRSIDKDADDHLRRAAQVAFEHLKHDLPAGLLLGAPPEVASALESHLHPYLRDRVAGRLDVDVEHASADEVGRAAAPRIEAAAREREDAAVARLIEAFSGGPGRAVGGLPEVLAVLHEQRVETLLVEAGFAAPGVRCPTCGWLGADETAECPADGSATEHVDDIVEAAVERALTQAADIHVLRDRAELASHGRIAAILRF